jgi:hypothetical protein
LVVEGVVDDAGEVSFEAAERFAAALSVCSAAVEVSACRWVDAGLGDRDLVEGPVDLAVAAAVEAVALDATAAGFERGDASVAGELGVACEAFDRADLTEQLCGSHWSAAWELAQGGRCRSALELALKLKNRPRERAAAS